MILVKRGGRESYSCSRCGKEIPAKAPHYRAGSKPYRRLHESCAEAPLPTPDAEKSTGIDSPSATRDELGRFVAHPE